MQRFSYFLYKPNIFRFSRYYCNTFNNNNKKQKLTIDPEEFKKDFGKDIESKSKETELGKFLKSTIRIRGPISVSHYFREAATNPKFGYYTRSEKRDILGTKGDFITAPEISQMFGEMIGVWVRQCFLEQFEYKKRQQTSFRLVEFGPGRGTLMHDVLRVLKRTGKENKEEISVHFIESSPKLRKSQARKLGCSTEICKLVADPNTSSEILEAGHLTSFSGVKVYWQSNINSLAGNDPVFIIAQEFLDALPVNVFQYTKKGWREVLIDIDEDPGNHHFKYIVSDAPSVSSLSLDKHPKIALPTSFVPKEGQRIEISLDRALVTEKMGKLVQNREGAAIIIDYGNNFPSSNTLRAVTKHKFADFLCEPGELDVTSDVDFQALRNLLEKFVDKDNRQSLTIKGPITQGRFLKNIGIQPRILQLLHSAENNNELVNQLISGYKRLVHNTEMGSLYKVLTFVPKNMKNICGFTDE